MHFFFGIFYLLPPLSFMGVLKKKKWPEKARDVAKRVCDSFFFFGLYLIFGNVRKSD